MDNGLLFELEEIALFDYTIQLIPDEPMFKLASNLKEEAKKICSKGQTTVGTQPHISLVNFSMLEKNEAAFIVLIESILANHPKITSKATKLSVFENSGTMYIELENVEDIKQFAKELQVLLKTSKLTYKTIGITTTPHITILKNLFGKQLDELLTILAKTPILEQEFYCSKLRIKKMQQGTFYKKQEWNLPFLGE